MYKALNININYVVAILITIFSMNVAWSQVLVSKLHKEVLNDLPNEIIKHIPTQLQLKVKALNQKSVDFCQNKIPNGSTYAAYNRRNNNIYLSNSLVQSAQSCPEKLIPVVKAKLAHEYFHAYDKNKSIPKEKISKCKGRYANNPSAKAVCKNLTRNNNRSSIISDDVRFLNIAQVHGRTKETFKGFRTYNPYELTNRYELSATNFEAFLYDEEYKCRRPSLYSYFQKVLKHTPVSDIHCEEENLIYTEEHKVENISPERIYQIHYMYADIGDQPMSWFGHSMIRFITCAPERFDPLTQTTVPATPMGEACLKDTKYHFVATFRAQVTGARLNNIGGLNGQYASKLYITPVKQVLHDYNSMEFRDIYSYPLNLNLKEKVSLINKVRETYWEYSGSYKFFSNNCATETYKLIAGALGGLQTNLYTPLTPAGVLHRLKTNHLITIKKKSDSRVIHYKSRENILEKSSKLINSLAGSNLAIRSYRELSADERKKIQVDLINKTTNNSLIISALKVLEYHTYKKKLAIYANKFSEKYHQKLTSGDKTFSNQIKTSAFSPHNIIKSSYGIPMQEELETIEQEKENLNLPQFMKYLKKELEESLKSELQEIKQTFTNIRFLIKQRNQ